MEEDDLYDGYNDFNSAFDTDVKFFKTFIFVFNEMFYFFTFVC